MYQLRLFDYRLALVGIFALFIGCAEKPAAKPVSNNNANACPQPQQNVNSVSPDQANGNQMAGNQMAGNQMAGNAQSMQLTCPPQNVGPGNATPTPAGPAVGSSSDLCATLKSQPVLTRRFPAFLEALCRNNQATLSLLRSQDYFYLGKNSPKVKIDSQDAGEDSDGKKMSQMQSYAAFGTPASPASYFELMQLKIEDKINFPAGKELFDPNAKVEYEFKDGNAENGMLYRYKKPTTNDAGDIDYEAIARFITLVPNKTYVVTTEFEKGYDMIQDISGLTIINLHNGITEVIGVSDQYFENGDNHSQAVDDAKGNLERELFHNYKQGKWKHESYDQGVLQ